MIPTVSKGRSQKKGGKNSTSQDPDLTCQGKLRDNSAVKDRPIVILHGSYRLRRMGYWANPHGFAAMLAVGLTWPNGCWGARFVAASQRDQARGARVIDLVPRRAIADADVDAETPARPVVVAPVAPRAIAAGPQALTYAPPVARGAAPRLLYAPPAHGRYVSLLA